MTAQAPVPVARFEVFSEGAAPQSVPITGSRFEIGRSGAAEGRLAMSDARVSRQAALVTHEDGHFYIQDLGQRKGLFLNDQALTRGDLSRFHGRGATIFFDAKTKIVSRIV